MTEEGLWEGGGVSGRDGDVATGGEELCEGDGNFGGVCGRIL